MGKAKNKSNAALIEQALGQARLDQELVEACCSGDLDKAKELLDAGASPAAASKRGTSCLEAAIRHGGSEELALAIMGRGGAMAVNGQGHCVLHWAAMAAMPKLLEAAFAHWDPLELGVESDGPLTPMMVAVKWASSMSAPGTLACVELLLPHSDLAEQDFDGMTALDIARAAGPEGQAVAEAIASYPARRQAAELRAGLGESAAPLAKSKRI